MAAESVAPRAGPGDDESAVADVRVFANAGRAVDGCQSSMPSPVVGGTKPGTAATFANARAQASYFACGFLLDGSMRFFGCAV